MALSPPALSAAPAAPTITLSGSPQPLHAGATLRLTGEVTGALAGSRVVLDQAPFPYTVSSPAGTTTAGPTGAYSFTVSPSRNTRYEVTLEGTGATAHVQVGVLGHTVTHTRALSLGRVRVTVAVSEPAGVHWQGAHVEWSFGTGFRGRLRVEPVTRARRVGADAIELRTVVTLPAGYFRWRACFYAPDDRALLNLRRPPGCRGRGYHGIGHLPVGYPGRAALARAARYLAGRTGRTAFAVVDSEGRISGVHIHWTFVSASVVKAMLLVAYLRRLNSLGQRTVDSYSNSFLYPMINVSDNTAATQTWSIVGDSGLYAVARAAHMTDFSIQGIWANAQISAADQAKFFFEMDSLIPRQFVGYARYLLSTIAGYESWGIPAIARPRGYQVFFKGGWRPTVLGQLVHQIARLEGHGKTFSIAVMTDGDPSMGYGIDTIQGVASALLGGG
jgi:hypothetical protein